MRWAAEPGSLDGMTPEPFQPTIRTQSDLESAWRHLVGPCSSRSRSVWLMTIEADDQPIPRLTEFAEVDELPAPAFLDAVTAVLREVFAEVPAERLAFLVSRPGHDGVRPEDRAWAAALYELARRLGLPSEVVHLATAGGVLPVPLDELMAG